MTWMHTLYDLITWTDAWHPYYRVVNDNLVNKANKYKKEIYVWTVNEEKAADDLKKYSVNGIITDEVTLIQKTLNQ
jgi:glycerophosphoryl diester phosphodiesterase